MTDPRLGDALWTALERLPRGAGVVFRHYDAPDRAVLWARVRRIARRRGLLLMSAGERLRGADGVHNGRGTALRSRAVHSQREMVAAAREGADVVFVSPIFATRSHPGARTLGRMRLASLVGAAPMPVIALGGMTAARFASLKMTGVYGWAGIDAWISAPDAD